MMRRRCLLSKRTHGCHCDRPQLTRNLPFMTAPKIECRKWRFMSDEDGKFVALAMTVDEGSELLSASPFSTLKECIEDAKTHGYVVPAPETCVNIEPSR